MQVRHPTLVNFCLVLNRGWAQRAIRQTGTPGLNPMRLWEAPLKTLRAAGDLVFEVGPLKNNGLLARGVNENYSASCYLVPPEPLRLSRLALQVQGATVREFNLEWAESNKVAYVRRFSERLVDRDGPDRWSATCTIELTGFEPNISVDPAEFELASLGVEHGTVFRANAPVPTKYIFDGVKLERASH